MKQGRKVKQSDLFECAKYHFKDPKDSNQSTISYIIKNAAKIDTERIGPTSKSTFKSRKQTRLPAAKKTLLIWLTD